MSATPNYGLPTEDARYLSLEHMLKEALVKIDALLKATNDTVAAVELRVTALEEAAEA